MSCNYCSGPRQHVLTVNWEYLECKTTARENGLSKWPGKLREPIVKDWHLVKKTSGGWAISGQVFGDTRCADGTFMRSSRVKRIDFETGIAVTQNTTYKLEGS